MGGYLGNWIVKVKHSKPQVTFVDRKGNPVDRPFDDGRECFLMASGKELQLPEEKR